MKTKGTYKYWKLGSFAMAASLVMALVLALAVPAMAQEDEEETSELDEVVVTATRTEEQVERIPSNVTVIDEDDIGNSTATTVQELLAEEAGLIVSDLYGNGTKSTVDMRGFTRGINTVIMIDGRRLNEVDLSGVDWNLIPLENVERIEVVRGSGSVLYGDNANAGVINIITKKGESETPEIEIGGTIDSWDFEDFDGHYEYISASGATSSIGYFIFGKYRDTVGFRENTDYEAIDINGTLNVTLTDTVYADLRGGYHQDEQGYPSYLTLEEMEEDRTQSTRPDDGAEYDQYFFGATLGYVMGDWAELDLAYDFNNREFDSDMWDYKWVRSTDTQEIKLKGAFNISSNLVVAGVDLYEAEAENASEYSGSTTDSDVEKTETGFYIQDEFTLAEVFTFTAGYRYSEAEFSDSVSGDYSSGDGEQNYNEDALKGGVAYNYSDGSKVFVSYSLGYRLPTTDELFSYDGTIVELDPERSETYELGIEHSFSEVIKAGITIYEMRVDDELFFNSATYANENIDETLHRGAETSVSGSISDSFLVKGAWSYTEATIESGDYSGSTVPLVPENKVSLSGAYTYEVAKLSARLNWVDERFLGNDYENEEDTLEDYYTVDLKLTLSDENGDIFFGVNNVFDEEYVDTAYIGGYYPGPGRQFYAGIKMTF